MRDLDKDPIQPADLTADQPEEETILETILSKLTGYHILGAIGGVIVLCILFIAFLLWGIPQYFTYLEVQDMRKAKMWAETHFVISKHLPEGTDLNEYLLYTNLEDTDIESLEQRAD